MANNLLPIGLALAPSITSPYVFLETPEEIQQHATVTQDYVGNLARDAQPSTNPFGPLRMMMSSAANMSRRAQTKSPTEGKIDFLKQMIDYFDEENDASRYEKYGCWCFVDEQDVVKGHGHPVDKIDESCRAFSHCYQCTQMTFDCSTYTGYKYFARKFANGTRAIDCLNDEFGNPEEQCRHTLCQCDRYLAKNIANNAATWKSEYHHVLGAFDTASCNARKQHPPAKLAKTGGAQEGGEPLPPAAAHSPVGPAGPLRVLGNGAAFPSPATDPAPVEDLSAFYVPSYDDQAYHEDTYYTDIYDSGAQFLDQEPEGEESVQPGSDDLRKMFGGSFFQPAPVAEEDSKSVSRPSINKQYVPSPFVDAVVPVNEHFCCGRAPEWFPYSTHGGKRGCCAGKTYDTSILSCCDNKHIRSSC